MMGLLHAAHSPFDSVLTPCRVMFSLRFAISSFSVSVLDPPVLDGGETVGATCEFTDCTAVGTELANCWLLPASGPDDWNPHQVYRRVIVAISDNYNNHQTPQPFCGPFPGPPWWAGVKRELLNFMVQGKINRGRHTDHPTWRHSIWTNQYPPSPSPNFLQ